MAVTLIQADEYFETARLNAEPWLDASKQNREVALKQAERMLEAYQGQVGTRTGKGITRARFFFAVCEQALWLIAGDKRSELQRAGVQSYSIGSLSETFIVADRNGMRRNSEQRRPAHIAPEAWIYLQGGATGVKVGRMV